MVVAAGATQAFILGPLPDYFLTANGTRLTRPSGERIALDATSISRKRQAIQTNIEVGGGDVVAQDLNAGADQFPQAFSQLFDYVDSMGCAATSCDNMDEYCVTAATGADVCIRALGFFPNDSRAAYISSTRGAFDRAVRRLRPGQGVIETGPDFVAFQSRGTSLGDGDLRVDLRNVDSGGEGAGCGTVISQIAAGGALFPSVATPFGALSFFCGAVDSFPGTATG
ncbi:hypothetical protein TI39_contig444g00001 [Zymoseptoria brevis]|uniref:Uncharacterized protein n=1 Tax=Zymoseptoria brevis TaxID=1047168 RepID=A0A0F4GLA9_9PEZI|nr:hypothetical protein TI39_contig444g00001 [Zymoseptoria brevis]